MRIQRFVADNIREAMRKVREEQGLEAVILSTNKVDAGVEIVTAMDYDRKRVHDAVLRTVADSSGGIPLGPRAQPAATQAAEPASSEPARAGSKRTESADGGKHEARSRGKRPAAPTARRTKSSRKPAADRSRKRPAPQVPPPVAAKSETAARETMEPHTPQAVAPGTHAAEGTLACLGPAMTGIRKELDGLRETLEVQLASLAWNDLNRHQPGRAGVLRQLARMDIDADVANRIVEKMPPGASVAETSHLPLELLASHLSTGRCAPEDFSGLVALVGPTGAGKTTTAAKLAAHAVIRHGPEQVAFITTDHYRVGGAARLDRYALLLGVPVYEAEDPGQLRRLLGRLKERRLVLVDGAGMAPDDPQLAQQMGTLTAAGKRLCTLLVLPACAHPRALERTVVAYRSLRPAGCILTKLDEAPLVGGAISVLIRHQLRLELITDGQGVPEAIKSPDVAVLLSRASAEQTTWDDEGMVAHEYCGLPAGARPQTETVES